MSKAQRKASDPDPMNEGARYATRQKFSLVMRDLRASDGANRTKAGHFIAKTPMCGYIEVTVELATLLLGWVLLNRPIDERNMTLLLAQAEHWVVTGDAVQIDVRGNVFEGQHRLLMIYLTGIPQTLLIAWGLPVAASTVGGDPRPRTLRDALVMLDVPDATRRAAWCAALEAVLGRKQGRVTRALGTEHNKNFDVELGWMSNLAPKVRPWCRAAVLAAFILAYRREPEKTEALAVKVLYGVTPYSDGSHVSLMRGYIQTLGTSDMSRGYVITCTILNGILAHLTRAPIKPLGGSPEGLTYFTRYKGFAREEEGQ